MRKDITDEFYEYVNGDNIKVYYDDLSDDFIVENLAESFRVYDDGENMKEKVVNIINDLKECLII